MATGGGPPEEIISDQELPNWSHESFDDRLNNMDWSGQKKANRSSEKNKKKFAVEYETRLTNTISPESSPGVGRRRARTPHTFPHTRYVSQMSVPEQAELERLKQKINFDLDQQSIGSDSQGRATAANNKRQVADARKPFNFLPLQLNTNKDKAPSPSPPKRETSTSILPKDFLSPTFKKELLRNYQFSLEEDGRGEQATDSSQVVSRLIKIRDYITKASLLRDDLIEKNERCANVERLTQLIDHLKVQENSYLVFLQKMLVSENDEDVPTIDSAVGSGSVAESTSLNIDVQSEASDTTAVDPQKEAKEELKNMKKQHALLTRMLQQQEQLRALKGRQAALLALQHKAEQAIAVMDESVAETTGSVSGVSLTSELNEELNDLIQRFHNQLHDSQSPPVPDNRRQAESLSLAREVARSRNSSLSEPVSEERGPLFSKVGVLLEKKQKMDSLLGELHTLHDTQLNNNAFMASTGSPQRSLDQRSIGSAASGPLISDNRATNSSALATAYPPVPAVSRNDSEDGENQNPAEKLKKLQEVRKRLNELRDLVHYYEQTSDMMTDAVNENTKDEEESADSEYESDSEQELTHPVTNIRNPQRMHSWGQMNSLTNVPSGTNNRDERPLNTECEINNRSSVNLRPFNVLSSLDCLYKSEVDDKDRIREMEMDEEDIEDDQVSRASVSSSSSVADENSSDFQQKFNRLIAAKQKLRQLQDLVAMVQYGDDTESETIAAERSGSDHLLTEASNATQQPNNTRQNSSKVQIDIDLKEQAREKFYESKLQQQQKELKQLQEERKKLIEIQEKIQTLQKACPDLQVEKHQPQKMHLKTTTKPKLMKVKPCICLSFPSMNTPPLTTELRFLCHHGTSSHNCGLSMSSFIKVKSLLTQGYTGINRHLETPLSAGAIFIGHRLLDELSRSDHAHTTKPSVILKTATYHHLLLQVTLVVGLGVGVKVNARVKHGIGMRENIKESKKTGEVREKLQIRNCFNFRKPGGENSKAILKRNTIAEIHDCLIINTCYIHTLPQGLNNLHLKHILTYAIRQNRDNLSRMQRLRKADKGRASSVNFCHFPVSFIERYCKPVQYGKSEVLSRDTVCVSTLLGNSGFPGRTKYPLLDQACPTQRKSPPHSVLNPSRPPPVLNPSRPLPLCTKCRRRRPLVFPPSLCVPCTKYQCVSPVLNISVMPDPEDPTTVTKTFKSRKASAQASLASKDKTPKAKNKKRKISHQKSRAMKNFGFHTVAASKTQCDKTAEAKQSHSKHAQTEEMTAGHVTPSNSEHLLRMKKDNQSAEMTSEAGSDFSMFEALRDTIYSEVATLISQNESRPHFLIELFHELQLLNSDYLRQKALFALQDIVTRCITEKKPDSSKTLESACWIASSAEYTPSQSLVTTDDEIYEKISDGPVLRENVKNEGDNVSNLSTSSNFEPFATDDLGNTVIHLDQALARIRAYDRMKLETENNLAADCCNNLNRSVTNLGDGPTDLESANAEQSGDDASMVPCPRIDTQQLDRQIKAIMKEVIPFLKEHIDEVCSPNLLTSIRRMVLTLTQQNDESKEFVKFFHKQLGSILQDSLAKFSSRKLKDCGEDLLLEISDVLFNELAFFRLMQDLDSNSSALQGRCKRTSDAVGVFQSFTKEAQKTVEDEESSAPGHMDDEDKDKDESETLQKAQKSENVEATLVHSGRSDVSEEDGNENLPVSISLSKAETQALTNYGSGEDENEEENDYFQAIPVDVQTSLEANNEATEENEKEQVFKGTVEKVAECENNGLLGKNDKGERDVSHEDPVDDATAITPPLLLNSDDANTSTEISFHTKLPLASSDSSGAGSPATDSPVLVNEYESGSGNHSQKSDEEDFVKVDDLPLKLSIPKSDLMKEIEKEEQKNNLCNEILNLHGQANGTVELAGDALTLKDPATFGSHSA
ncbi:pericentriolar material 1 isoform X1 [Pelobates cultripes]|uniref:Pericentriolar material 1 isoform X1 n=1 Tax=Pelobates cultripes TaxID=61616 RepID=A0AAD1SGR8_PELCU|nr:pericentriolar material 1 isoform X1 [Pelobates cultripes]